MEHKKVNEIFVFITIDEKGDEGVTGFQMKGSWMPMVCADWDRVQSLKTIAQQIANASGLTISLIKLENRSHVEDIKPRENNENMHSSET